VNKPVAATLDTGIKLVRNVGSFNFGRGAIADLAGHVETRRSLARTTGADERVIFVIDQFFKDRNDILARLPRQKDDVVLIVDTTDEPTTAGIDSLVAEVRTAGVSVPATIVGFGGGITLDTAKAIANLLTNPGSAADYQGWDLVKNPAVHKIGVPTISGTGAEATRTCVMTNKATGLKLGMNSDFTVFNHLVLDPDLTATVPRDQYFFTGMDAYIHCIEALAGSYRNAVGDAYSHETINLCQKVFLGDDMMSDQSREDLMVASYLGGSAIATSYVGVVHPFSAGLSVVLGIHHCVANCITMRAMEEFYPEAFTEFWTAVDRQGVVVPEGVARGLTDEQYKSLYDSTVVHSKPLTNALGEDYKNTLTFDKVVELFKMM
jgi:3-deoxy-alpha-D-manno-octulosonate 8-oxidase